MRNHMLVKTFNAGAAVAANCLVKPNATNGERIVAAAATDKIDGVCGILAAASGDRFDVVQAGIAEVKAGGTIAAGDLVTSNASGYAVAATVEGSRIAGIAQESAVSGDLVPVLLQFGVFAVLGTA